MKRRRGRRSFAACGASALLAALAALATAQEAPAPQRIVIEGKAELSADEQRRLATGAITVIGRDELDEYGDSSIHDVLNRVPGISVDGEVPRLRGLGAGYTQILLNGEPAPPGFSLDTLAPVDIERIEIVKGPSAEFGGVAGTINVILRTPPRTRQREWRGAIGYRTVQPQGSTNVSWGNRIGILGFSLPLSIYSWANGAEGTSERRSRLPDLSVRDDVVQSRDRWLGGGFNFGPRLEWKLSDERTLAWQTFVQRNESRNRSERETTVQTGPPVTSVRDESASRGVWELARSQLQWLHKEPSGRRFELKGAAQASASRSVGSSRGIDAATTPLTLRDSYSSQRESGFSHGGRVRWPLSGAGAGGSQTLAGGWDIEYRQRRELRRLIEDGIERLDGSIGIPFHARTQRAVLFAQDEFEPAERWSALVGLRVEHFDIRTAGRGAVFDNAHTALSPIVQLRHALDAKPQGGQDVVRIAIARSQRVPDIGALMPRYAFNGSYERDVPNTPLAPDSAGNPLLKPERVLSAEVSVEKYLRGGGVLSASVFQRRIADLIRRQIALETVAEAPVPRWVSRPSNIGRAQSTGLQLEVKGRGEDLAPFVFEPKSGATLRAALSIYRSRIEQIDDPDARLDGQPPWAANLGLDQRLPKSIFGWGASLALGPGFSTQQTDRQRIWRRHTRRLDAYAVWRFDRLTNLRIAAVNLGAPDSFTTSSVQDEDGFVSTSRSRRTTNTQWTATLTHRF